MKYRLKRDDGVELDVSGALWESVLERAYWNGWRPAGTDAPGDWERRTGAAVAAGDVPHRRAERWSSSNYFSACSQHVRATDARELAAAAIRGHSERWIADALPETGRDADVHKVAHFARLGGFLIGRAPEPQPSH